MVRVSLVDLFPEDPQPDAVFDAFTGWAADRGLTLYDAQEEALMEIVSGNNVIVGTPTGSGKSLIAAGAHFAALAADRTSFYTAPIKALVSEKFFDLCDQFGTDNVGMMTGDASVNADAPLICCTAEVLANIALRDGEYADVGQVVMDEFHFYSEPGRGWAWQVPLLELPHTQFVLMSATLGDTSFFEKDLTRRTGRPTVTVTSATRPVPLYYRYSTEPLQNTIELLLADDKAPVYIVHFTQAAAMEQASALMSINVCTKAEKAAIADLIGGFRFTTGFGKALQRLVKHGIGVHHAGMLPKYRRLVERLAQAGLLKVICGTDTLGVGVNVPIRTVLFTGLSKYDGHRVRRLRAREFHQIAGRAGRAGFDTEGLVVAQAPEHVIENQKAVTKAGDDPKKLRKLKKKAAPEGFVGWSRETFENLQTAPPEPLVSRFTVSNAMLLNVIARPGDAFEAMRRLLTDNHAPPGIQRALIREAIAMYRSLLAAGIVETLPEPDRSGRRQRLTVDLDTDFALNQPLAPFALAALEILDADDPDYPLDVISVVESILEDPRQVLAAQQNRARAEAVAQMKADGVEYDERVERVSLIEYPKPLEEQLTAAYTAYGRSHPWIKDHPLRPKSVVRDLYERAMTFGEFIAFYELSRAEGVVLRYLAGAYKTLDQTIPESASTEELRDVTAWLGELVRQVDSSLLDEWEQLSNPQAQPDDRKALTEQTTSLTSNRRAFTVAVRNAMFRHVELAALDRPDLLAGLETGLTREQWQDALDDYYDAHDDIGTDAAARSPRLLLIESETPQRWRVAQILADPAGDHDWRIEAEIDLPASDAAGVPVVTVTGLRSL
ncbi:helicase-like protein [Stackebrandtia albiflava]|uniref:Helicase-like protein n=1 Tax=Stackebrandtia albiflava TaxID=406432 RepID=A0A562VDR6_9ACTN|nr:DEAD/DEAH box helicase [Stackebrandtia albiflava]TWJ15957.1 helicase-like protein [Stackebrandtia albiflava]